MTHPLPAAAEFTAADDLIPRLLRGARRAARLARHRPGCCRLDRLA